MPTSDTKLIKSLEEIMKNTGIIASIIGLITNFALFLTKLYVGISSNSLAIYCDAINNLGDTFACIIVLLGFYLAKRMTEIKSNRTQSLFTFVISIIIAVTGAYFIYNGLDRVMYPLPVSYSNKYAIIIAATIVVKVAMAVMYIAFNKKQNSSMLKALVLDSVLDCIITAVALMSLLLITKINIAVDGFFAIITGTIITIMSIKNIVSEAKYLINN